MTRLHDRLARLEACASGHDKLETITWANGATLTLPRHVITEIVREVSTGRSSFPVSSASLPAHPYDADAESI